VTRIFLPQLSPQGGHVLHNNILIAD